MSLRQVLAVAYRTRGKPTLDRSELVVSLSLDRDWFSPDQAKAVVERATSEGLLDKTDGGYEPTFDPGAVDVSDDFEPASDLLDEKPLFDQLLETIEATGIARQRAVADINELCETAGLGIQTAGIVYASRNGIDVQPFAEAALESLIGEG